MAAGLNPPRPFPSQVELVASKLLRLMQDTCWDCKFDVSRAPSLSRLLSCGAPRAPVLPLVSGDVVALLPALSLTVGAWLRAGRDAAYDAECPAWCSVAAQAHAVSVLGSEVRDRVAVHVMSVRMGSSLLSIARQCCWQPWGDQGSLRPLVPCSRGRTARLSKPWTPPE